MTKQKKKQHPKQVLTNNIFWKHEGEKKVYFIDGKSVSEYELVRYFIGKGLSSSIAHKELKKIKQQKNLDKKSDV